MLKSFDVIVKKKQKQKEQCCIVNSLLETIIEMASP